MFDTMIENNDFAEAFAQGKEGKLSNYEAWMSEQNLDVESLSRENLIEFYEENPDKITDRTEVLEKIGEYSGYLESQGGKHHVSIQGVSGSGKTQILKSASSLVNKMDTDLEVIYLNAKEFQQPKGEKIKFNEILGEISEKQKAVVMIDNAGKDKRNSFSIRQIKSTIDQGLILTVWNPQKWRVERDKLEEVGISDEVYLSNFSKEETDQFISTIFGQIIGKEIEISDKSKKALREYSRGVPELIRKIIARSTKESFLNNDELFSHNSIKAAASEMGLNSATRRIRELTEAQKVILRNILLSIDERGTQPKELKKRLDRDKSTISYHLGELKSENILKSEKIGRSVFYSINEDIKPIVQAQIEEEGIYG